MGNAYIHSADNDDEAMDIQYDFMDVDSDASDVEYDVESVGSDLELIGDDPYVHVEQFVNRIIRNDTIHLYNQHDINHVMRKLPKIKEIRNLDNLRKNDIYQIIKNAVDERIEDSDTKSNFSMLDMLLKREMGIGPKKGTFIAPERKKLTNMFIPNKRKRSLMRSCEAKIFCGSFTRDGNLFITGSQDSMIRVFDSSTPKYRKVNKIKATDINWGLIDLQYSPDGKELAYSTWSDSIFIVPIDGTSANIQSLPLISPRPSRFCVFSLAFSNCDTSIITGTSDGCIYIYDRGANRRTHNICVSDGIWDINSVGFMDDSSQTFYSGLDNGNIKIWDTRQLSEENNNSVGTLLGHFDGITYIDSKNDNRYLISNSKDQSIKLWDIRVMGKKGMESKAKSVRQTLKYCEWDYRWDQTPTQFYRSMPQLPGDTSIMTYKGHRVLKSLLRAKFSPESTGQRYIYTACGSGRVIVYDILTGYMVRAMDGHTDVVRDVAWHPYRNEILSSSWDYKVHIYDYDGEYSAPTLELPKRYNPDRPLRRSQRLARQREHDWP